MVLNGQKTLKTGLKLHKLNQPYSLQESTIVPNCCSPTHQQLPQQAIHLWPERLQATQHLEGADHVWQRCLYGKQECSSSSSRRSSHHG